MDENITRCNDIIINGVPCATIHGCRKNKQSIGQENYNSQDVNCIRRSNLAKIDGIIETFVSAMKETQIRRDFTIKIVNLHKNISTANITDEKMNPDSKCLIDTLNMSDLINHFSSMVESFVTFANNYPAFQSLCNEDQSELLKRNSLMFIMVS